MKVMVVVAGAAAVTIAVALFVGTQLVLARVSAANAADAAALAAAPVTFRPFGATGTPRQEAARLAAANGARLVWCRCPHDASFAPRTVETRVAITRHLPVLGPRTVVATGRARFEPARLLAPDAP